MVNMVDNGPKLPKTAHWTTPWCESKVPSNHIFFHNVPNHKKRLIHKKNCRHTIPQQKAKNNMAGGLSEANEKIGENWQKNCRKLWENWYQECAHSSSALHQSPIPLPSGGGVNPTVQCEWFWNPKAVGQWCPSVGEGLICLLALAGAVMGEGFVTWFLWIWEFIDSKHTEFVGQKIPIMEKIDEKVGLSEKSAPGGEIFTKPETISLQKSKTHTHKGKKTCKFAQINKIWQNSANLARNQPPQYLKASPKYNTPLGGLVLPPKF